MESARFLDRKEDYEKLGLVPGVVQPWEDGRMSKTGQCEVWYFDAVMADGSKFVGGFRTKPGTSHNPGDEPMFVITVTEKDGREYSDSKTYPVEESELSRGVKCDVHCGPHSVVGDLKDYYIKITPLNHESDAMEKVDGLQVTAAKGVGVDLHFHALVNPFRHGAGRTVFGDNEEQYSSWFCIPSMKVEGTITINGEVRKVSGIGYHDHRVMALNDELAWHHWTWARQTLENHSLVLYDLISTQRFGFTRIPLFAVYNKAGEVIFDNDGKVDCQILERHWDEKTKKEYPKKVKYFFEDGDKKVEYTLTWLEILEIRDFYWCLPEPVRAAFDKMNVQISYIRYYADGELKITIDGKTEVESGSLIYEFAYPGKPHPDAHL